MLPYPYEYARVATSVDVHNEQPFEICAAHN